MFIEALLMILPTWKEPKSLPTGEWIKKFWPIQIMEYCTTVRGENRNTHTHTHTHTHTKAY